MDEKKDNDLEYHLNDPEDVIKVNNHKKTIIILLSVVLILVVLGVVAFLIIKFVFGKKDEDKDKDSDNKKKDEELKFNSYLNISYGGENNEIENTFKTNGSNYNDVLGEINNGENYKQNPSRNLYDLYIPKNLDKNQYNKIILLIHGGSYQLGDKSDLKDFCESLAIQGNIAVTMAHTFLNNSHLNSTIFRIQDEIATVIKNIKSNLKEKGFDETKLEIAIGGASSGSHLALLYAYFYKNSPLEIKYVINMIGPVTYESQYFYVLINKNDTLDQIDEESIKKYEEEKKIMPLYVGPYFVQLMNIFLGYNEYNNLFPMIKSQETWEIDTESPAYKELLEKAKLSFPITYVNKDTPPTICFYTGKDEFVGVKQYSYLKSEFEKNGNDKIDLIYVKSLNHVIYIEGSEEAKNGLNQLFGKIAEYSQRYFTPNNK